MVFRKSRWCHLEFSILLAAFFIAIFAISSAILFYICHGESVDLDKRKNLVFIRRYRFISFFSKMTVLELNKIIRVHAIKTGYVSDREDRSTYQLVLTYRNNSSKNKGDGRLKILETKNYKKILKQVTIHSPVDSILQLICLRKFIKQENEILALYDETRDKRQAVLPI